MSCTTPVNSNSNAWHLEPANPPNTSDIVASTPLHTMAGSSVEVLLKIDIDDDGVTDTFTAYQSAVPDFDTNRRVANVHLLRSSGCHVSFNDVKLGLYTDQLHFYDVTCRNPDGTINHMLGVQADGGEMHYFDAVKDRPLAV